MTDRRSIDEVRRQAGERRKNLERMIRWAIKARTKCKDDQDQIILLTVLLDSAAEVLGVDPKKGS